MDLLHVLEGEEAALRGGCETGVDQLKADGAVIFGLETDERLDAGGGALLSGNGETGGQVTIVLYSVNKLPRFSHLVAVLAAGSEVLLGKFAGELRFRGVVPSGEGEPEEGEKDRETHPEDGLSGPKCSRGSRGPFMERVIEGRALIEGARLTEG